MEGDNKLNGRKNMWRFLKNFLENSLLYRASCLAAHEEISAAHIIYAIEMYAKIGPILAQALCGDKESQLKIIRQCNQTLREKIIHAMYEIYNSALTVAVAKTWATVTFIRRCGFPEPPWINEIPLTEIKSLLSEALIGDPLATKIIDDLLKKDPRVRTVIADEYAQLIQKQQSYAKACGLNPAAASPLNVPTDMKERMCRYARSVS